MTIHRMLQNVPLGPERIAELVEAYQATLKKLNLVERDDPMTQMIAKKIIEIGQTGVRDPKDISKLALSQLGLD
jgi:hypothetical protein